MGMYGLSSHPGYISSLTDGNRDTASPLPGNVDTGLFSAVCLLSLESELLFRFDGLTHQ